MSVEETPEYVPRNDETARAELKLTPEEAEQSAEREADVLHAELTPEEQELLEKCDLVFKGPIGTSEIGEIRGVDEHGNRIYLHRMYKSSYGREFTVHAEIIAPDGDPQKPKWGTDEEGLAMWQKYEKVARIQTQNLPSAAEKLAA